MFRTLSRLPLFLAALGLMACGLVGFEHRQTFVGDGGDGHIDRGPGTCSDALRNQDEEEPDCGGVCAACPLAKSCAELHQRRPDLASNVYQLDIDAESGSLAPFSAYCEMVADGGGWTLAAKIDGAKTTFAYDNNIWTNSTLLNPASAALDTIEAKLSSFTNMPFTELRVVMVQGGVERATTIAATDTNYFPNAGPTGVPSLSQTFSAVAFDVTTVGTSNLSADERRRWLSLVDQGYVETTCNRFGINKGSTMSNGQWRVRIGILGDNTANCPNVDSFVGFGFSTNLMGACSTFMFSTQTGNGSRCSGATNDRDIAVMGYLMVR